MLWQWCSMLMRQCVVQPQAVIFQVISRVLNTRLLLFHLLSSRSGFSLRGEGPLAVPGHPRLLLAGSSAGSLVEEQNLRPLLLPSPERLERLLGRVSRRVSMGPQGDGLLHECCLPTGFPLISGQGVWKDKLCLGGVGRGDATVPLVGG